MNLWHAQVFVRGRLSEDDFADLGAAKIWVESQLLRVDATFTAGWRQSGDLHEVGASPDLGARVVLIA
jgi:hypothetical protein